MGFWHRLVGSAREKSLVLIDVSAGSVAGAYVHYTEEKPPLLLYTRRVPIEVRGDEPHERAMLRALDLLGADLIRDGAPALARAVGSGRVETVLVSIDAPWQETSVRTERFEKKEPFLFTKRMLATTLAETSAPSSGKFLADQSIVGTILNGYETHEPYGKSVRHASVIVLTSLVDEAVSTHIAATMHSLFHTKNILSIAGSSLRYQALRVVFPHEYDALILDAIGPLISIALVRKGLLVAVNELSENVSDKKTNAWTVQVKETLTELAKHYPLPRTVFLLSQDQDVPLLEKALGAAELSELWLSVNPPKVIRILPSHVSHFIRQASATVPDLTLVLMSLYWPQRPHD